MVFLAVMVNMGKKILRQCFLVKRRPDKERQLTIILLGSRTWLKFAGRKKANRAQYCFLFTERGLRVSVDFNEAKVAFLNCFAVFCLWVYEAQHCINQEIRVVLFIANMNFPEQR